MNVAVNPSTNCVPPLPNLSANPDSTVEELDPFALGASEEVNTTTSSDGRTAFTPPAKTATERNEATVVETAEVRASSLLNSPLPYKQPIPSMVVDNCRDHVQLKGKANECSNSENVTEKAVENGSDCNVTDTEASLTTTTVVSEGVSPDAARGFVVVEQVALEHITQLISAPQTQDSVNNDLVLQEQSDRNQFTSSNQSSDNSLSEEETRPPHEANTLDGESCFEGSEFEEMDTREVAETLTNELKKYSIPQAVFARKVLNRSQGTLSDVLRKPKPWSEMKGGRDIFRKMKEWLDLPEVKRIPQLRAEAALELDLKARNDEPTSPSAKRARLHFTDSQKRALFAIFKETKKPSREMQIALAEELGLERGTVANFFMNARRRHPEI